MELTPTSAAVRRLRRVPRIRRARGCHLYTVDGRRLLDLYRDGGRAILGHRLSSVNLAIKNGLDSGLTLLAPSSAELHLRRDLSALCPHHRAVRVYPGDHAARLAVAAYLGCPPDALSIADPGLAEPAGAVARWRPYTQGDPPADAVVLPLLPIPAVLPWTAVLYPTADVPDGPPLPPVAARAIIRAVAAMNGSAGPPRMELPGFHAVGPYLRVTADAGDYDRVFDGFLAAGFLISPEYPGPTICPAEISPGEAERLKETCRELLLEGF